jgi:riboflavin kinase / FMN adenylyltransferase
MQVFRSLAEVPPAQRGRAVAVGTFDGVHLGHREVIRNAREWGREHDARVAVVTFDPHPLQVLQPDDAPPLLTPTSVKVDLIGELGVEELVPIPFTEDFSRLEAVDFCRDVLAGSLGAVHVSVGENFRFGHGARGDAVVLAKRSEFETSVVPLVHHGGAPVSSSRIRSVLAEGEVSEAAVLLGGPFQLEGVVVEGDRRGRLLGMPTANVAPVRGSLLPGRGIYAGRALDHAAAISIGTRPTFESDAGVLVEAHLIEFEGDLYGKTLRLSFLERLREELRFESAEALVEQMRKDVERVRELCRS